VIFICGVVFGAIHSEEQEQHRIRTECETKHVVEIQHYTFKCEPVAVTTQQLITVDGKQVVVNQQITPPSVPVSK